MHFNYSVAVLKKAAFLDELNNTLNLYRYCDPLLIEDNQLKIVISYLEKRILQINEDIKLHCK